MDEEAIGLDDERAEARDSDFSYLAGDSMVVKDKTRVIKT